ncbi:MAG TPA: hypothetical protein VGM06_20285 [Polyangiaceae bacterium]|jgi:hypothetical protein
MTISNRRTLLRFAALVVLALAALLRASVGQADDFVVVRNASNEQAAIHKEDLFKIYTGETKQVGGWVVQTVIGKEDSGELQWLSGLFDMRPKDLLSRIKQQVFSGEMRRPIVAKTPEEALAAVQNNRGGLAVVTASAASSLPQGIAVLAIQ